MIEWKKIKIGMCHLFVLKTRQNILKTVPSARIQQEILAGRDRTHKGPEARHVL